MEISLIACTPDPLNTIWLAYRQCRTPIPKDESVENKRRLVLNCIKLGHLSPLEHANFTFSVSGISRAASHQLVRHRIASYSQLSQRAHTPDDFVVPPEIAKDKEAAAVFRKHVEATLAVCEELSARFRKEDIRYLLPQAMATSLIITMNCRTLLHFFEQRCHVAAQWEIRQLANAMRDICKSKLPEVFDVDS